MADTLIELDSSDDRMDEDIIECSGEDLAEKKKESGNQLYKSKLYQQAIPFYTEAIELCPQSASYYGNRSACYMMLHQYKDALNDARKSITLDPKFVKGYVRIAKCCLSIGDIPAANNAIEKVLELEPSNTAILPEIKKIKVVKKYEEDASKAYEKNDYRTVVYCMDRIIEQIPCVKYKIQRAECLAYLGRYQDAQEVANDILHSDKQNADAIFVRGTCLYYQDNVDKAFTHFQHILKLAPDHKKALEIYKKAKLLKQKKDEGNEAFKANKFNEAFNLYSEALKIDPNNILTNAKLYFNRATVCSKLGHLKESVSDCTAALTLDPSYLKALLRRARSYMLLHEYEDAVHDYEAAVKLDKSRENKRLLQDAKLALKKSKRKDYYKILGIDKNASTDDIKKAYRKRALDHHPENKKLLQDIFCKKAKKKESKKKESKKKKLKKSKRNYYYYKILGIDKNASAGEIKKAYHKRALDHHPDRHAGASSDEKKEQEKKFKEVGEAYGVLSDPRKRARYDNGQDLEEMGGGMGADVDPTSMFRAFFGEQYNFGNGTFTFQFG